MLAETPSYRTLDKATVSVQTITGHAHNENENFKISVLIRADHYWYFAEDRVICGNGLTAVQSR